MLKYIINRVVLSIPMLVAISFFACVMTRFIPGDPGRMMLGERATKEAIEKVKEEYGLNDPVYVQYFRFLKRVLRGDLGESIQSGEKIINEIVIYLPATIELTLAAMIIGTTLGIIIGVFLAYRRNTWIDNAGTSLTFVGISMPIFWLGLVLIYYFSLKLGWFPSQGRTGILDIGSEGPIRRFYLFGSLFTGDFRTFWDALRHIVLPAIALGTIPLSLITRITRSAMVEELEKDYVKTARAKGLHERTVIYRHALKNGIIPVITVVGLQVGYLLGGAIITETVFSWPGMGRWLLDAVQSRNYPVIQIGVMLTATIFIFVNLATDLLYPVFDPRIRLSKSKGGS